jgi:hypothetical protein
MTSKRISPIMLKIRPEQMEEMSEYMLHQFEERMVEHLHSAFPDQTEELKKTDLQAIIRTGVDKAESYDVTDEVDVERYLECIVQYGTEFDTDVGTAWAGEILRTDTITGNEKMNQINDYELFVLTIDKP